MSQRRGDDPGGLYRALRQLERDGLVRPGWEKSESVPDRRISELTRRGMEDFHGRVAGLLATRDALESFLSRYSEFVTLARKENAAGSRRYL